MSAVYTAFPSSIGNAKSNHLIQITLDSKAPREMETSNTSLTDSITFVVATNDKEILAANLCASPALRESNRHQVLIQENFPSATRAYNDAIRRSRNDLMVFIHQDVYIPVSWISDLQAALDVLEQEDPSWGVLGCWGVTTDARERGYLFTTRWGLIGKEFQPPTRVQTLDEVVLIMRKSSGLYFDDSLPHYHFYGTDICMAAASHHLTCYAISALCIHNTKQISVFPKEFYKGYQHVKRRWKEELPIHTSCTTISRFDSALIVRNLKQKCLLIIGRSPEETPRLENPATIITALVASGQIKGHLVGSPAGPDQEWIPKH